MADEPRFQFSLLKLLGFTFGIGALMLVVSLSFEIGAGAWAYASIIMTGAASVYVILTTCPVNDDQQK